MSDQKTLKIYSESLIDRESELHYVWHKSINNITQKHTHDFYELFLITDGSVKHIFNGQSEIISAGTLVFIRPTDIHAYVSIKDDQCSLMNIAFPKSTLESLISYLGEGFQFDSLLESTFPPSIIVSEMERQLLIQKISEFDLLHRSNSKEKKTKLRILLFEIFTNYFNKQSLFQRGKGNYWLHSLRNEMIKKDNFVEGFSAMLRITGKSKEHISREFKKEFKVTPTTFINDLRLNYAANLLTNSDESIIFVSMEVGFENLSHFYHLFKKKFGVSPLKFRKINMKIVIP